MRLFISKSTSSPRKAWSLLCTALFATAFSGMASAALEPGFCGDCQTYANAIQPCGGTFTNADIQVPGEYVLTLPLAKCICSAVIQRVLWTCAKCAAFGGSKFAAVPPNKYQTQCMAWGTTVDQWNAPYTGIVAPGTQTDTGGGPAPPPPPPVTSSTNPQTPKPSGGGSTGGGGMGTSTDSNGNQPTGTSDNATSGEKSSGSSPDGKAIGISVGIIGVAAIAGVVAVFMMKRRRRRRPLNLDSSPALANFMELDSHGSGREKNLRPTSPPMQYDHYGHGHGQGYDGYSHGQYDQYGNQYDDQYYDQGYYDQHQHGYGQEYGYDRPAASQGPTAPPAGSVVGKPNDGGQYL
ncbi:hypothetical protein BGZ92_011848 [Podila epicladia]|nr:hypothetical protein BGZ92_011848 [Podila epicladia]